MQKEIKVVPIGKYNTFFRSGNVVAGAHLVTDGLNLQKPATLRITLPGGLPAGFSGFQYDGYGGDEVDFIGTRALDESTLETGVMHFSGAGVTNASAAEQADSNEAFKEQILDLANRHFMETGTLEITPEIELLATAWLDDIKNGISSSLDSPTLLNEVGKLADWFVTLDRIALDVCDVSVPVMNQVISEILRQIENIVMSLDTECSLTTDLCEKREMINEILKWLKVEDNFFSGYTCLAPLVGNLPTLESICNGSLSTDPYNVVTSSSDVDVAEGKNVNLTTTITNYFNDELQTDKTILWSSNSPAFSVANGVITGQKIGSGFAKASIQGAQCIEDETYVDVLPNISQDPNNEYVVNIIRETHHDSRPQCQDIERNSSYVIKFENFSPGYVKWSSSYLSEISYGKMYGLAIEMHGLTSNPWYPLQQIAVDYYITPVGSTFVGRREWHWAGAYDPQTGTYGGCTGTEDIIMRPRVLQINP